MKEKEEDEERNENICPQTNREQTENRQSNKHSENTEFKNWGHSNPLWIVGGAGQYIKYCQGSCNNGLKCVDLFVALILVKLKKKSDIFSEFQAIRPPKININSFFKIEYIINVINNIE